MTDRKREPAKAKFLEAYKPLTMEVAARRAGANGVSVWRLRQSDPDFDQAVCKAQDCQQNALSYSSVLKRLRHSERLRSWLLKENVPAEKRLDHPIRPLVEILPESRLSVGIAAPLLPPLLSRRESALRENVEQRVGETWARLCEQISAILREFVARGAITQEIAEGIAQQIDDMAERILSESEPEEE
jgi:hypothetical protein